MTSSRQELNVSFLKGQKYKLQNKVDSIKNDVTVNSQNCVGRNEQNKPKGDVTLIGEVYEVGRGVQGHDRNIFAQLHKPGH